MNKSRKIFTIIIAAVFCCSAVYIGYYYFGNYQTAKETAALEEKMNQAGAQEDDLTVKVDEPENSEVEEVVHTEEEESDVKEVLVDFRELYEENSDIVGWLKIEGTSVSYPVMQNKENSDFYLDHGFDKKEDVNGLPLLDKNCNIEDPSTNLIIHGHNMKSGMIFGELMKYKKESYYLDHPTLEFNSLYEKGNYEIISVFLSRVYRKSDDVFKYYQFTDAKTEEEFNVFMDNIKKLSLYDIEADAQFGDQLVTLSTCEYSYENGRLVVVAKKIK